MASSTSHLSYGDCYKVMDDALADTHGVRVSMTTMNACTFFRMRLHQARAIDRKRNRSIFQEGDALYGTSQYDPLVIRIRLDHEDNHWIYIEKAEIGLGLIEPLSSIDEPVYLPEPEPQVLLPPPSAFSVKRRV